MKIYTPRKSIIPSRMLACTIALSIMLMAIIAPVGATGDEGSGRPDGGSRAAADHLLLTEACVTPTAGEFLEIHNPTDDPIELEDYYLADIPDYYNIVNSNPGFDSQHSTDFVASFPSGSSIGPGGYKVIAFNSSEFLGQYNNLVPNFCLEGGDAPLMNGTSGFIGGSVGLTDSHETVVLFHWDGINDLVKDVDIIWWGDDTGYKVDKSGVDMDSEFDGDGTTSSYNADASSYPRIKNSAHTGGKSFKRTNLVAEPDEIDNGGNGLTGHDETSENLTASWSYDTPADPVTTTPDRGSPVIRTVGRDPSGDPRPGTDVTITANVTDDGSVDHVNITIVIDGGVPDIHSMTHGTGDDYTYTITYAEPPMGLGISVGYNVTATDDEGNVTVSDNYTYTYLNITEPVVMITEVMFDDVDAGDDWIELYCVDDGNAGNGLSLDGWGVDDMDSDHDKSFGDISVRTGEIVLVRYNDDTTPDEENDTDGNGIINTYTGASNTRLKVGGDQVVLYDDDGNISDAVAWTFNDTLSSGTEADDMADLFDEGEWVSAENSSCVDSEDVPEGWSISRSKGDADTDSKADWYIIEIPEPGVFRNLTNTLPDIADVTMDPTPVHDTILPLTNVTVTAAITDDAAILSANITWSLNGTAQGRIPMNDNATLPDLDAGDDNWTGVIPGQPADSVVIFSIEATDASLETGTAGPFTITFSEPPKMLTIRITEVMFSPVSGNNWVEIFCQEDGNGGTGYDLTDWYVDDLDGDPDLTFEGTIVKTGEYILVHFDNGSSSENNSQAGNGDGIIDVFTTASDGTLSSGGDQVVLYDAADQPVDAVAWQRDGTLSAHEQTDMADLLSSVMWDSSAIDSCLDVTTLSTGESLSRMFNVTGDAYLDSNGKADWFISDDPTPGEGLPPPEPFVFEFTTLTADVEMAPPTKLFTVTWSVGGDAALISLANLTLCYLEGDLNAPEVFITYLEPEDEEYVWNVSGLDDGDYYLRVKVNDGMNPPYTVNTTYPLRIAPFPVPEVTSTVPLDGAGKLDVHTAITIVFSTEVKPDSLIIGTTVDISPATDGEATVNSGNTVVITPDDLLRYDTLYTVTVDNVRSVHDIVMDDSYEFSFTTETEPLWELSARIGTDNATVEIDGKEVDLVGGAFSVMRANGSYELKVTAEGFVAYTKTVRIDGDDATLPEITLEPELTDVPIGPFVFKGTTDCIEGVNVYFNLDGEKHSSDTDSDGYARFTIPGKEIPDGIEITALYGGKKVSCIWPDDDALYDSFEKEKGDDDDGDGENGEKGANTVLWIVLISLVIVIVGVIVAIVVVLLRSKKETAAPGQYEPGEEVSTEEPEWDGEGEADAEEAGTEVTTEELPEEGTEGGEIPADAPLADENGTAQAGTDDGGVEEAGTEQAEAEGGETGEGVSTALAEHDGNAAGMAPLENVFAPFPEGSEGSEEDLLDDN